jgi:hypothetical protein
MPFIQLIEKLMPLIEKFVNMLTGDNGAVDTYNNSNKTDADKKTFLDSINKELKAMQQAAANDNIDGNEFQIPDKVDSQIEVDEVIRALEDVKAKSPALAAKIDKLIDTLKDVRSSLPYSDPGATGSTGDNNEPNTPALAAPGGSVNPNVIGDINGEPVVAYSSLPGASNP